MTGLFKAVITMLLCLQTIGPSVPKREPLTQVNPPSLPELIAHVRGSVVMILVMANGRIPAPPIVSCPFTGNRCIVGTGFFVDTKGDVITAGHVSADVIKLLQQLQAVQITGHAVMAVEIPSRIDANESMEAGNFIATDFTVKDTDKTHDIALLSPVRSANSVSFFTEAAEGNPKPVEFDSSHAIDGTDVFACGYPVGSQQLVTTSGHVAGAWDSENLAFARDNNLPTKTFIYKLDLRANLGNSGSPVFDSKNQTTIGIIVEIKGIPGVGDWIAIAVPSIYIRDVLRKNSIA
jgi:S1-C subfamily serine protease